MKKQNLKKFVKKHIVLQDKLEKFLLWRKKSSIGKTSHLKSAEIQKLKNQKVPFKEFLKSSSLKTKFIKYHPFEDVYKIYKPITGNLFQSFTRFSLWNPKFFPEKKPFMQFWIFPLLGACFFNNQSVEQNRNILTKNPDFFSDSISKDTNHLNMSYLPLRKKNRSNNSIDFIANYGALESKSKLALSEQEEFEKLCRFYLNLTSQKLTAPSNQTFVNVQNHSDPFFEKNLLQSMYFQKSQFNWLWYSLNTRFLQPQLTFKALDQKLNDKNSLLTFNQNSTIIDANLDKILKNPVLSYNQASKIFDLWVNSMEFQSFENIKNPNLETEKKNLSKTVLQVLEKIYEYNIQSQHLSNSNQQGVGYLSNFLTQIKKTESELKQVKENGFSPGANSVKQISKNILQYSTLSFKKDFLKILLKKKIDNQIKKKLFPNLIKKSSVQNILTSTRFFNTNNSDIEFNNKTQNLRKKMYLRNQDPNHSLLVRTNSDNLKTKTLDLLFLNEFKEFFNEPSSDNLLKVRTGDPEMEVRRSVKLAREIQLYQRLNEIGKKILILPNLRLIPSDSSQKVLKYKTPILMTSISEIDNASEMSKRFEMSQNSFKFDEFNIPQTSVGSSMTLFKDLKNLSPGPTQFLQNLNQNTIDISSMFRKLKQTINTFDFLAKQLELKKTSVLFSNFAGSENHQFSISKEYKTNQNQSLYFLTKLKTLKPQKRKKVFKQKSESNLILIRPNIQTRKFEKLFRGYFSVKNRQTKLFRLAPKPLNLNVSLRATFGSNPKKTNGHSSFQELYPFLKKLKMKLKDSKLSKTRRNTKQYHLNKIPDDVNSFLKSQQKKRSKSAGSKNKNVIEPVLVSSPLLTKLESFHFLKASDFFMTPSDHLMFEKKKSLQKKRRLKKLRLENRRRKKRKRFYPRPNALRFQLYFDFLQKRHSRTWSFAKASYFRFKPEAKEKNHKFKNKIQETKDLKQFLLKEKIYGQSNHQTPNVSRTLLTKNSESYMNTSLFGIKPTCHEKEFYKISNQTLTEFERLCWKSYWLRSNLKPYIHRIQENLKRMQSGERMKSSENFLSTVIQNLSYPIQSSLKVRQFQSESFSNQNHKAHCNPYLNLKETTRSAFFETPSSFFNDFRKGREYENVLYNRTLEEIQNVKNQLNVNGQSQPRSYKVGRLKLDKPAEKRLFNSLNSIQNNYFNPSVQGSILDTLFSYSSAPAFGDLPTLRVLWALNKTQLFTYKQNNFSKQIWTLYKQREQTKNNKTRKFFLKFSPFKVKNLETMSKEKTKVSFKKIRLFGGHVLGNHSSTYLRELKFKFQRTSALLKKGTVPDSKVKQTFNDNNYPYWFETNFQNKLQKRRIHFWWLGGKSNATETSIPLFMFSSPMSNFGFNPKGFHFGFNPKGQTQSPSHLNNTVMITSLWIGCCLFHLAIFFTVLRIPEIRSLLKFQFLILSKLTNAYIISLFAIYDIFRNYKLKMDIILKKVQDFSFNRQLDLFDPLKSSNSYKIPEAIIKVKKYNLKTSDSQEKEPHPFLTVKSKKIKDNGATSNEVFVNSKIRFTLNLDFQYRDIFDLLKLNLEKQSGIFDSNLLRKVYDTIESSLNASFTTNLSQPKKIKDKEFSFLTLGTSFLWFNFSKDFNEKEFLKKKDFYLKEFLKNSKVSLRATLGSNPRVKSREESTSSTIKHPKNMPMNLQSQFKIQYILSLGILAFTKLTLNLFYQTLQIVYQIILKGIDCFESILLLFYTFLEKPAELMVDWIADLFLVEWSADSTTYIPEAFDRDVVISVKKWSRGTRFFGNLPAGFLLQRLIFNTSESLYSWFIKQDADLITRQKKGVIFWDIWGEILIQAAEKYKMNLSSLNTVKEEQELLIENLLEDQQKENISSPNFLNSKEFKHSIVKMEPLTKFLQNLPPTPKLENTLLFNNKKDFPIQQLGSRVGFEPKVKTFDSWFNPTEKTCEFSNFVLKSTFKKDSLFSNPLFELKKTNEAWKRWSVNQYLTTQGRDTDLFMDIHPPKSFLQLRFLKSYLPAQEILGSLVCEIYSGLFANKISKNILIVGAPGTSKSFFIQALAGETELKIVTDNAHRYSFVNNGIPVGMKLLREVFDSLALHTPCLFVLEDIHIIGERRPMLLSDDEISKTKDGSFGGDQEEVHEKNRLLYQFSRHSISHYKKPYKGDFSSSLATNHFSYDLFLGVQPPRKRNSNLTAKNPLPLTLIEKTLNGQDTNASNNLDSQTSLSQKNILSSLQLSMEQIFAPPATSPFNILVMKEQKKLRPKKVVKEMPWSGLSYDQLMLLSKSHYSVRVKVALLAESAMTNLSMKLDMITDLLVIIDSVRANRGFVVFVTTHVPSLLDPALRRPGRFDETLSLPLLPNLNTRFEILRTGLSSYTTTIDLFDLSLFTSWQKQTETEMSKNITKARLLLLNSKNSAAFNFSTNLSQSPVFKNFSNDYSIYSIGQAFQTTMQQNSLLFNLDKLKKLSTKKRKWENKEFSSTFSSKGNLLKDFLKKDKNSKKFLLGGHDKLNYFSLSYAQAGQFLVEALLIQDQKTYGSKFLMPSSLLPELSNTEESLYQILYSSKIESENLLLKLFAGKISEFFVLSPSSVMSKNLAKKTHSLNFVPITPSRVSLFENIENFQTYWQSAISFLSSLAQKRYLYNKNTIVSKMLLLEDQQSLREPPNPPNSSILMPSKKFENYKRTLKDFIQKPILTIHEKLQIHQKQRFLKLLYQIPVQKSFQTFSKNNPNKNGHAEMQSTNFYHSFKELGYLDLLTIKPSSTYAFYKNRFLTRQRFSFLNQWWNGQLAEHNVETTYLSHVDWRSMFVQSLGDLVIDFPDADQYYNPRKKRWYLQSDSWSYWFDLEKNFQKDISEHSILQCFTKTSNLLNSNRELFDYLAYRFLRYHQLKEIDLIQVLVRFYKNQSMLSSTRNSFFDQKSKSSSFL